MKDEKQNRKNTGASPSGKYYGSQEEAKDKKDIENQKSRKDGSSGRADQERNSRHNINLPGNDECDQFDLKSLRGEVDGHRQKPDEKKGTHKRD